MASYKIKNVDDAPVCITNPETGVVYSLMPGYSIEAKVEWEDVRRALRDGRIRIESVNAGK